MDKVLEALESLISKTGCMNDTCAHLGNCLKDNKCRYDVDNSMCQDYEMAKNLKNALTELKAIKKSNPNEALDRLLQDVFNSCDSDEVLTDYETIKQALLEFKRLDLSLRLPSEQSSSHFTYKDNNLVCMQLTKYNKLMNASLEYEKILSILKDSPFILQKIFENKGLKNQEEFDKRYFWGTITEDKYQTIKEWLESDKTK